MSIYLVTHRNYLDDVEVVRFATRIDAEAALVVPEKDPAIGGFVVDPDSNLGDLSSKVLVDLFNLWREPEDKVIVKFENRTIARQRFIARLEARFSNLPVVEAPVETQAPAKGLDQPQPASGEVPGPTQETEMAEKAAKKAKEKKAGEPRVIGKPAGLVASFGQIRDGTDRQRILKLMNGTKTPIQIGTAIEKDEKYVLTAAYCIHRDCGIGYRMIDGGKLEALFPGSKTYEDAIKKPAKAD